MTSEKTTNKKGSIFVAFGGQWPKGLAGKYDAVITPGDLNKFIEPGSVEEAYAFTRRLSLIKDAQGRRISKIVNYKGFELWWMNYDSLMQKFALPFTQYRPLLEYLKDFSKIYLYEPPFPDIFKYFLDAHNCRYEIKPDKKLEKKFPIGILLQAAISLPFLLWLKLRGPKLMLWTSDRFDPPRDHNFRMKLIYEELRGRKINFAEFIRSMEPSPVVLSHALKRKRPVIYSYAIVTLVRQLAGLLGAKEKINTENDFWSKVAVHYIKDSKSDIWAINAMKFILRFIGIKAAIINAAINRNFPEVLACKLLNIKTFGIQHGLHPRFYFVSDFMHEFDGEKTLSVDKYGLWSEWVRQYYLKYSRAYKPEQLCVSGLMRPLEKQTGSPQRTTNNNELVKVLFVAEELAAPQEVLPYLEALIEDKNLSLYVKFRSYKDGFEKWLVENRPDVLKKISQERILKGGMHDAVTTADVVVGSHSAGVVESVLQLKPFVLFWTNKWRDFLELKADYGQYGIFVNNPDELVASIQNIRNIPEAVLKKIQEERFGDPYRNGSKWLVDQAVEELKGRLTK